MELYKRNNQGKPLLWRITKSGNQQVIWIYYGIVGKNTHAEYISTTIDKIDSEINSRINDKRKEGYKELNELRDNAPNEINDENALYSYLDQYLPKFNSTSNGVLLPMLAKTLEDNKPFEKSKYVAQYKINGERCMIYAERQNDIFNPIKLRYFSRKGIEWTEKISYMDEFIIPALSTDLLDLMLEENVFLDGELYLPGYTINEINHFIKDINSLHHYDLQYWCFDLGIESMNAIRRNGFLTSNLLGCRDLFNDKDFHLNNKERVIVLQPYAVTSYNLAIMLRDSFIRNGFEGLVMRKTHSEYQFGKRNSTMFKFKKIYDGLFTIKDIVPEGERRKNLPKFILKNDINDEYFECTINLPQSEQETYLTLKNQFIGKSAFVEYRERSGVKEVPFHAKIIRIEI